MFVDRTLCETVIRRAVVKVRKFAQSKGLTIYVGAPTEESFPDEVFSNLAPVVSNLVKKDGYRLKVQPLVDPSFKSLEVSIHINS